METGKRIIHPRTLGGKVYIPPSKSMAHRYLLGAALSEEETIVENLQASMDIEATLRVLENLGVDFQREETLKGTFQVRVQGRGGKFKLQGKEFQCGESGSTLRFLLPLLFMTDQEAIVLGEGKLGERPLTVYYDILEAQGISYETKEGNLPLHLPSGRKTLQGGVYSVRGDISSQFITGLLYALPLLKQESTILLTTTLESRPYIDLTLKALKDFGLVIENREYQSFHIPGGQSYRGGQYRVEGDYSQLAFFAVAGVIGSEPITCLGLKEDSLQGDKVIIEFLRSMGARVEELEGGYVFYPSKTKGIVIDSKECPDLVPALSVLASLSTGESWIINGERLKIKESNRLVSTSTELQKLGAHIEILDDSLRIEGVSSLSGGEVDSWNDHRVAMSLAAASCRCTGDLVLTGAESVAKSYPGFWDDFRKLGGNISE